MNVQVQFSICSKIEPNIQKDIHNESFYQSQFLFLNKALCGEVFQNLKLE